MTEHAMTFGRAHPDDPLQTPAIDGEPVTFRPLGSAGRKFTMTIGGVDMTRYVKGPRTLQREAEYRARRAKLGTEDGRNDMVDMVRTLYGMSMVRRANRARAGCSAEGRARQAGRGQTPPLSDKQRAERYIRTNGHTGFTVRQARQLDRMWVREHGEAAGDLQPTVRPAAKGRATPRRPRNMRGAR